MIDKTLTVMNQEKLVEVRSLYLPQKDGTCIEIRYCGKTILYAGPVPLYFLNTQDWPWDHAGKSEEEKEDESK